MLLSQILRDRVSFGGKRFWWRSVAVGLALTAVLATAMSARADAISDKQNQANQEQQLINQLKQEIAAAQNQENQLQALIASLNQQITIAQQNVDAAQAQLNEITQELQQDQAKLAAIQAQEAQDKTSLRQTMKIIYEASNNSTALNNLVGAKSFNDFWTNLLNMQRVGEAEQQMVNTVIGLEAQAQQEVQDIAAKQAQQQQVVQQLSATEAQLNAERWGQQQAQNQLAALVASDQNRLQQAIAAENLLQQQIAQLIAEQQAAAQQGGGNGQFSWPEPANYISQDFGCTGYWFEPAANPDWGYGSCSHFHTGIDIPDSCGTDIHAADAGIANAYYTSYGYGDYVVIVHGNGWISLYGHMSNIAVHSGEAVARGQYIGNEGSTGNSTGCHLHFEIRYNNVPKNPINYLP